VHARYEWESPEFLTGPVWRYPREERGAPEHAYSPDKHGALRARITHELERLTAAAAASRTGR
jgi:hypothetical protein